MLSKRSQKISGLRPKMFKVKGKKKIFGFISFFTLALNNYTLIYRNIRIFSFISLFPRLIAISTGLSDLRNKKMSLYSFSRNIFLGDGTCKEQFIVHRNDVSFIYGYVVQIECKL